MICPRRLLVAAHESWKSLNPENSGPDNLTGAAPHTRPASAGTAPAPHPARHPAPTRFGINTIEKAQFPTPLKRGVPLRLFYGRSFRPLQATLAQLCCAVNHLQKKRGAFQNGGKVGAATRSPGGSVQGAGAHRRSQPPALPGFTGTCLEDSPFQFGAIQVSWFTALAWQ